MIIQVVGLPCSGKSTAIKKIIKLYKVASIDSQDMPAFHTVADIQERIASNRQTHALIESACGYDLPGSIVIMLRVSPQRLQKNKLARAYSSTAQDEEQIYDSILPADYTTYSVKDLCKLIATLIRE